MESANDTYTMSNNNMYLALQVFPKRPFHTFHASSTPNHLFFQLSMHFLKSINFPPLETSYKIIHHKLDEVKDHYLCEDGPLFPQSENYSGKA